MLNFGLDNLTPESVFIRYRQSVPGFILYRNGEEIARVDRLLLHIDFPAAERDEAQGIVGIMSRGTGILKFCDNRPPYIISRDVNRAAMPREVGFVLDVASPYPLTTKAGEIPNIGRQIFASTFPGARTAFHNAYIQYRKATERQFRGIPVFDVYGWETPKPSIHQPRLQLCAFVPGPIMTPLADDVLGFVQKRRTDAMAKYRLDRPRIGIEKMMPPSASAHALA